MDQWSCQLSCSPKPPPQFWGLYQTPPPPPPAELTTRLPLVGPVPCVLCHVLACRGRGVGLGEWGGEGGKDAILWGERTLFVSLLAIVASVPLWRPLPCKCRAEASRSVIPKPCSLGEGVVEGRSEPIENARGGMLSIWCLHPPKWPTPGGTTLLDKNPFPRWQEDQEDQKMGIVLCPFPSDGDCCYNKQAP